MKITKGTTIDDFSHNAPMLTMPIGIMAELDADAKTIRLVR
ncbi:hypothetical protein [Ruminococcus sp.]|nr:hypothetical protein [Ruminococcus sp.]